MSYISRVSGPSDNISEKFDASGPADHDLAKRQDDEHFKERSSRHRQLTEKGTSYMADMKNKRLRYISKNLEKKCEEITGLSKNTDKIAQVQHAFDLWLNSYEEFKNLIHESCRMLPEKELEDIMLFASERDSVFFMFKEQITEWLHNINVKQEPVVDEIKPEDSVSQISRRSGRSSKASGSVSSAKLREEQRRAELEARATALMRKKELELAQLRLKQDQEELCLQEEIAVCDAKRQVIETYERDSIRGSHVNTLPPRPPPDVRPKTTDAQSIPPFNPGAPVFYPQRPAQVSSLPLQSFVTQRTDQRSEAGSAASTSEEVIRSVVMQLRKPTSELDKFDGSPLKYKKFMRQFKNKIVNNTEDDDERMSYLEQYTTGEAHKIVSGLGYLDASIGYRAALEELETRYGDPEVIVNAYIRKALDWPVIKATQAKALDEYSVFLSECQNAVQSLQAVKILEYSENFKRLVAKLPFHLHDKWRNIAQQQKERNETVTFTHLVNFVKKEAKKANDPIFGRDAMQPDLMNPDSKKSKSSSKQRSAGSFATKVTDGSKKSSSQQGSTSSQDSAPTRKEETKTSTFRPVYCEKDAAFKTPCLYCKKEHSLDKCEIMSGLDYDDRIMFLKNKSMCYGCLKPGHMKKYCRNKATCKHCQKFHPSVLHYNRSEVSNRETESPEEEKEQASAEKPVKGFFSEEVECNMGAGASQCTFAIIPVNIRAKNSTTTISTYAFLDNGSNVNFCSESLMQRLGANGKKRRITVDTMGEPYTMSTYAVDGLQVSDLNNENFVDLDLAYTKTKIPASQKHIPKQEDLDQWPHLKNIEIPSINAKVELLIGNNVPDMYTPLEIRTGPRGSPHASRTLFGWVIWNLVRNVDSHSISINRTEVSAVESQEEDRRLDHLVQRLINMDFPERTIDDKREHSVEDKRFIEKMEKSLQKVNGHYKMDLPFRKDDVVLPNNEHQVLPRLTSLKQKFEKNPDFKRDYTEFMNNIIDKGFAEQVPAEEISRDDGRVWYIPHHGVYHPHKPGKIRVVFNCSAMFSGISLNQLLLQGPDLTNSLVQVLLKFRKEPIAVMADITSMFYQVHVSKKDVDCLRFFWWPNGETTAKPVAYRMLVHLFGATSSPTCANVALRKTAEDNKREYPSDVCNAVLENFYVDDFLISLATEEEAIRLAHDIAELCKEGGFNLSKWTSNSRAVIETIPVGERAKELKELDLEDAELPTQRVLGVMWHPETDQFGFKVVSRQCSATRRNLLSVISSLYDPLGFASPVVLKAKMLLQSLCKQNVPWDEVITGEEFQKWSTWLADLPELEQMQIPRCIKPVDLAEFESLQIHYFCDASELGYGVVAYVRIKNSEGLVHCSLLMSRARVAPLKKTTIPRLELTAATMAVRLHHSIISQLGLEIHKAYFWSDSMAVLRYIWNEHTRFHTFVANRVSLIREGSDANQWKFINSTSNPADDVSRGLTASQLLNLKTWKTGPEFLDQDEEEWPQQPQQSKTEDLEDDPEVKKKANVAVEDNECQVMQRLLTRFSSWLQLKKTVAWLLKAKGCLKVWVQQRKSLMEELEEPDEEKRKKLVDDQMKRMKLSSMKENQVKLATTTLTVSMLEEAELAICLYEQRRFFEEEIVQVQSGHVKRTSALHKLDPVLIDDMLRVGGRLEKAPIPYDTKHQILLPGSSPVSKLILSHIHNSIGHLGKNAVLSEARQKFWILGANSLIKQLLSKCVTCRKYQAGCMGQKMADLPLERTIAGEPPFTRVGMDYFGPFEVKRGRSTVKRYGVIFTCLSIRAIHLEVAASLTTDSCINAIRRFVSRRGPVKVIVSDNGTNLVGAEKELRKEIENWNETQIHECLLQKGIEWRFNPPAGSHFGGVWERMIRMVRRVMYALLKQQVVQLDDEGLMTLFCEIEAIINNRPITVNNDNPNDLEAITPSQLLLLKPGPQLPCGLFTKDDNYARRRWRQIQHLADAFWRRWSKEYLTSLQERQKWNSTKDNVKIGDIVLVTDNLPRNSWALGKVMETITDRKGLTRIVKVKTSTTELRRPIHKLVRLLEAE